MTHIYAPKDSGISLMKDFSAMLGIIKCIFIIIQ